MQSEFISKYMHQVFEQGILALFFLPQLDNDDFEAEVTRAVISIGLVFESLKPTLNECAY